MFRILPQAQKPYPGLTYFSSVSQKQNHRSQKARGFPRVMGSDGLGIFVSVGGTVCMLSFMVVVGTVTVPPLQLVTAQSFFSKKPPACQDLSLYLLPMNSSLYQTPATLRHLLPLVQILLLSNDSPCIFVLSCLFNLNLKQRSQESQCEHAPFPKASQQTLPILGCII